MKRFMIVVAFAAVVVGAAAAQARTCTTNCYGSGNYRTCNTVCY
jgi:hypothetical protein